MDGELLVPAGIKGTVDRKASKVFLGNEWLPHMLDGLYIRIALIGGVEVQHDRGYSYLTNNKTTPPAVFQEMPIDLRTTEYSGTYNYVIKVNPASFRE